MAYLIFTANGEEYDRRALENALTIGRAADCDVSIHDILLSRHHCQIQRSSNDAAREQWVITDLHSKNGTHLRGFAIQRHVLLDGDELRMGRTRVTFKAGAFAAGPKIRRRAVVRAADPSEALAGTVSGMVVCEPGEIESDPALPSPKPRPADPTAYLRDDVYGMISDIISSSWDSVMAQNSEPIRMQRAMPVAAVTRATRGSVRPKARVSFALQAAQERAATPSETQTQPPAVGMLDSIPARRRRIYAAATVVVTVVVIVTWVTLAMQATPRNLPAIPRSPKADPTSADTAPQTIADLDPSLTYLVGY